MKNNNIIPSAFSMIIPIGLFVFLFSQLHTINAIFDDQRTSGIANRIGCGKSLMTVDEKQRGAHVFGKTDTTNFPALIRNSIVWKKEWFAGVHIWQWRSEYVPDVGKNDLNFTPQGKPAENIIAKGFE